MIKINIENETSQLKAVVLGIANDFGGPPDIEECCDPKSKEHLIAGTYPNEENIISEMDGLEKILIKYGVKVYRPSNKLVIF